MIRGRVLPVAGGVVIVLALVAAVAGSVAPGVASAFWSVDSVNPSSGSVSTATVNAGATPVVTVATQNDITVDWDMTTLSQGAPATSYTVTRYNASNTAQATLAGCAGTLTATVCTENNVPDGLWTYAVAPRFATNWVGTTSPRSVAVRADATAPTNVLTRVAVTGGSALVGNILYFRGSAAGSFRLSNALADPGGSGPASSATSALGGTSNRWSHTASTVLTPTGGPFQSSVFSWQTTTTTEPSVTVTGLDISGNTAGTTVQFRPDNAAPTGGAITYPNGFLTASSVNVTVGAVTETSSGVATRELQRRTATLTGTTCGTFGGAFTTVSTDPAATTNVPVTAGTCSQYQYVVTDAVGNVLTSTSTNVLKVRSYAMTINGTAGSLNHWRLGETGGTTIVATKGTTAGTWSGGPTFGTAGAIAGDPDTAVTFDGVNDYGRVTRTIATDFSIEFWFKSTQGLGAGPHWWTGAGLVDAELGGATNDFGVSLLADGRIAAGAGSPDVTALSPAGYNNNVWHHVVMTRTQTTGQIQLYVDGVLQSTVTGSTAALNAPANIDFGRLQTGMNYYQGSLDEIALYTTALPTATILTHYQSGLP